MQVDKLPIVVPEAPDFLNDFAKRIENNDARSIGRSRLSSTRYIHAPVSRDFY